MLAAAVALAGTACGGTAQLEATRVVPAAGPTTEAAAAIAPVPTIDPTVLPARTPRPPDGNDVLASLQANGEPHVLWFWGAN